MKLPDYKANEYKQHGRTYSRETLAPVGVLDVHDGDPKRRAFLADNCDKLADLLEQHIPDKNHNQGTWTNLRESECGTTGCALGWAAMMHIIPGLQHRLKDNGLGVMPTVNGATMWNWHVVGAKFFGEEVLRGVFLQTKASKAQTIASLRGYANSYRRAA